MDEDLKNKSMSDLTESSDIGDSSTLESDEQMESGDASPDEDSTDEEVDTSDTRLQRLRDSLRPVVGDETKDEAKDPSRTGRGNALARGLTLMQIGEIHTERGRYGEAEISFAAASDEFRSLQGTAEYSHLYVETALRSLAHTHFQRRRYREAMNFFIDAEAVTRNSAPPSRDRRGARRLGAAESAQESSSDGAHRAAESSARDERAGTRSRRRRSRMLKDVDTFLGAGVALTGRGELQSALDALLAAVRGYEYELGSLLNGDVAETMRHIGMVYELLNLPVVAMDIYREALAICTSVGVDTSVAIICERMLSIEGSLLRRQSQRQTT